jgi:hypothetical protein
VIREVDQLGSNQKINWLQTTDALSVKLPDDAECKYGFALRVKFAPPHPRDSSAGDQEMNSRTKPGLRERCAE